MTRCLTYLYLGLVFSLTITHAQSKGVFRFEFSVYGLRPGEYSNIYFEDAQGKPTRVHFQGKQRSDTYQAEIHAEYPVLRFARRSDPGEGSSEPRYRELAAVEFAQVPGKTLLVFVPSKGSATGEEFRVLPVEDQVLVAGKGTVRIMNLTGVTLLGVIDGKRFQLPTLSYSQPFNCSQSESVDFSVLAEGSSRYQLVYRNSLKVDPQSRALLFLTPPYRKASLKLGGQMLYEDLARSQAR